MKPQPCRESSCRAPMFWLVSAKDPAKRVPVDAGSLNAEDLGKVGAGEALTFDRARGHVSHYLTCKKPGQFSKKRSGPA